MAVPWGSSAQPKDALFLCVELMFSYSHTSSHFAYNCSINISPDTFQKIPMLFLGMDLEDFAWAWAALLGALPSTDGPLVALQVVLGVVVWQGRR